MLNLALWLKKHNFRLDQVQTFLPTPLALATAMWHNRKNPLRKVTEESETMPIVRSGRQRKLHKAFLRYHDPAGWPLLREALKEMGRADLIGPGKTSHPGLAACRNNWCQLKHANSPVGAGETPSNHCRQHQCPSLTGGSASSVESARRPFRRAAWLESSHHFFANIQVLN